MKLFSNYSKFLVLPLVILGLLITASLSAKVYASGFTTTAPVSGTTYQYIQIEIHETAALADHSLKIIFTPGDGGPVDTVVFTDPLPGNPYTTTMNAKNILDNSSFQSATYNSLSDGTYTVRYEWQLADLSPVQHLDIPNIYIDTVTDEGSLITPSDNGTSNANIHLQYSLPENPKPGTVYVTFQNSDHTIDIQMNNSTDFDGIINGDDVGASSGVAHTSQATIPDGTYLVILTYQDEWENPANPIANANFTISRAVSSSSSSSSDSSGSSSSTSSTSSTSSISSSNSSASSNSSKSTSSSSLAASNSLAAGAATPTNIVLTYIVIGILLFLGLVGILGWLYRKHLIAFWNNTFHKPVPPAVPAV